MKMYRSIVLWCCLLSVSFGLHAQTLTSAAHEKRMEWFDQAKLGIFIHWGIYAVNGVSESWSFYNNYLPYPEYMNQMKGFTASKYNPKEWVDLIKESG
ncbi:MAG: alpha-L-fucosidase, partial [Bacteroides sp.]